LLIFCRHSECLHNRDGECILNRASAFGNDPAEDCIYRSTKRSAPREAPMGRKKDILSEAKSDGTSYL